MGSDPPPLPEDDAPFPERSDGFETASAPQAARVLPLWRKLIAGAAGSVVLVTFLHSVGLLRLAGIFGAGYGVYIVLIAALSVLAFSISRKSASADRLCADTEGKRKLSKRNAQRCGNDLLRSR
jgi:energy-coupling factor transport system ATP-binding protein